MTSNREGKCQICEAKQDVIDAGTPRFSHLRKRLEDVINSQDQNWLRFLCLCCREKLDDLWEFQILCKNAYKKFLEKTRRGVIADKESEDHREEETTIVQSTHEQGDQEEMPSLDLEVVLVPGKVAKKPKKEATERNEWDVWEEDRRRYKLALAERKRQALEKKANLLQSRSVKVPKLKETNDQSKSLAVKAQAQKGPFTCALCDEVIPSKANLRTHMTRVHLKMHNYDKFYLCDICGRKFTHKPVLKSHLQTHVHNRLRIPCELCTTTFTKKTSKNRHIKEVHEKSFKTRRVKRSCRFCKAFFYNQTDYGNHMKSHPGARRVRGSKGGKRCHYCPKEFRTNQSLETHERVHTGEKPFVCGICAKRFTQETHLARHLLVHTGERNYPCEYCDKKFSDSGNRRVHMRIHTGEKPYECSSCSTRFADQKMWKKHSLKCSQEIQK